MVGHEVVVIGASAGAIETLKRLLSQLPDSFPAAVFVVVHISPGYPSQLAAILRRAGTLEAVSPRDKDAFEPGRIYVAPPDHHLLVDDHRVRVVRGPRHDGRWPGIDPMFESASRAYGSRVVGVVLSGTLDDGAAGLRTIRRRGGLALIQDPSTAMFHGMPRRAIELVPDAEVVPLDALGNALVRMVHTAAGPDPPADPELDRRFASYLGGKTDVSTAGTPSAFACPECNGVRWQMDDGELTRYECRIGHSYSPQGLLAEHGESVDLAMEAALRALDENCSLNRRIARHMRDRNRNHIAERIERKASENERHAQVLREILKQNSEPPVSEEE